MSTTNFFTKALQTAIVNILKPLVRILIRNGVPYGMFTDMAKWAYYQVAWDDFKIPTKRQTANRVSMMTGLSRKEILRLRKLPEIPKNPRSEHRGMRVIGHWMRDKTFHDAAGKPAALPLEDGPVSFAELVKQSSGDITPQTVIDELQRIKAIDISEDGYVHLLTQAYIPKTDGHEKLRILGTDVSDLINTINHNLGSQPDSLFLQRKVYYDNIPKEKLEELRALLTDMAQGTLEQMNQKMVKYDRDRSEGVDGEGRHRAGVGMYYFENAIVEDTE